MKKFSAEMKVVRFGAEDMIVTSGKVVTLSKFNDGNTTNNTFSFGGNSYTFQDNASFYAFRSALASYVEDGGLENKTSEDIKFGGRSVGVIFNKDISDADGDYTYDGLGTFTFSKKQ